MSCAFLVAAKAVSAVSRQSSKYPRNSKNASAVSISIQHRPASPAWAACRTPQTSVPRSRSNQDTGSSASCSTTREGSGHTAPLPRGQGYSLPVNRR